MVCGPVLLSFLVFVLLTAFFFLLSSAILMPNGKFCAGLFSFYLWYKKKKVGGRRKQEIKEDWCAEHDCRVKTVICCQIKWKSHESQPAAYPSMDAWWRVSALLCVCVWGGVTSCKQAAKVCVYPTCFYLVCSSETSTDVLCLWAQSPSSNTFNNNFEPKKKPFKHLR